MKKSTASKALAQKKATASAEKKKSTRAGGEKTEHRMPDGRMMKGKMY
jgi:hypothetical protein